MWPGNGGVVFNHCWKELAYYSTILGFECGCCKYVCICINVICVSVYVYAHTYKSGCKMKNKSNIKPKWPALCTSLSICSFPITLQPELVPHSHTTTQLQTLAHHTTTVQSAFTHTSTQLQALTHTHSHTHSHLPTALALTPSHSHKHSPSWYHIICS